MKVFYRNMARGLALAFFLGIAVLGVAAESMAAAAPTSIEHCGHGWGGRGGHGGCGW